MPPTEVVLFDLGGVLIRLSGLDAWKEMSGQTDDDEIWHRWLHCSVVQNFERGNSSVDDFVSDMIKKYDLSLGPEDFLKAFINWPDGLFDGAVEVVNDVADHVRLGCFSNTNYVHWETQHHEIQKMFDVNFLSFKMGHVKPDADAFEYVIDQLGCDPEAILFLDDNIINVEAARVCGINAHVALKPEGARRVLNDHKLLKYTNY
jgi:glucose-1-phosphatase